MESTLLAKRSKIVDRVQLAALEVPTVLGRRHRPVPHHVLLETLEGVLGDGGLRITEERLAVSRDDGARLFGVLQVEPTRADHPLMPAAHEGQGFAIGLRSSVDCKLSIRLNASARVFVCDNLCMSGASILVRKSTIRLDLPRALAEGVERYVGAQLQLANDIERARNVEITDEGAKVLLHDVFARRVLPARLFHAVVGNYFTPEPGWTDCAPRTVWGVHNSLTRAMRDMAPAPKFRATIALAGLLKPGRN
jgi:hypothetical protein